MYKKLTCCVALVLNGSSGPVEDELAFKLDVLLPFEGPSAGVVDDPLGSAEYHREIAALGRNGSLPCCTNGLVRTAKALHAPNKEDFGDIMSLRPAGFAAVTISTSWIVV